MELLTPVVLSPLIAVSVRLTVHAGLCIETREHNVLGTTDGISVLCAARKASSRF